jgi:hypothetical protein
VSRVLGFAAWVVSLGIGALFLAQLLALWTHRVDYPLIDDWRYYQTGFRMPAVLSLEWLLAPAQDTVHASGKLFDWLFFRLVAHDYRLLAAASYVLAVGSWLGSSLVLCLRGGRGLPGVRVAALVAFVLPLAGVPYWVTVSPLQQLEPAIAYHQMLPMAGLVLLAVLALGEAPPSRMRLGWAVFATMVCSLAYASGAFSLLLFASAALCLSWASRRRREEDAAPPLGLAAAVAVTAALALALHVALPALSHGVNPVTEARAYQMTWPFEARFWSFFFGLFDRAVLATSIGPAATLRGMVVATALAIPMLGLAVAVVRGRFTGAERAAATVLASVFFAVFGYAALVSYGRAGFGLLYLAPFADDALRPSLYAHTRFFCWWITAVLPLAVLAWGLMLRAFASVRLANGFAWALLALFLLPKPVSLDAELHYFDAWRFDRLYQRDAERVHRRIEEERGGRLRALPTAIRLEAAFVERWDLVPKRRP